MWREVLSWSIAPSFEQIIKSLNIPAPKSTVAPISQEDKDLLYEYNFENNTNIKSTWVYRILNKVKNREEGSVLIEEEGFSRVKRSLQDGLLNLNNGIITLSTKGEHLWELLTTRLLPARATEIYTDQYFDKIAQIIGDALVQADATDIISFWRTPKKKWDNWYLGQLNKKVIQYIGQIEKSLFDKFGTNISAHNEYNLEELSISIIQEAIQNTGGGGYGRNQSNKILDYVRQLHPRKNIEYVVLESDGELAGHTVGRTSTLNFSWRIHSDEPRQVALAEEDTIVEGGRTRSRYVVVNFVNGVFEVELGNDRGSLETTAFHAKEDAYHKWDTLLQRIPDLEIMVDSWSEYE